MRVRGNFSMMWISIISSWKVIKAEACLSLGNGESFKVWKEKWLHTLTTFQVQSPITQLDKNALANDLFLAEHKEWNVQLVYEIFGKKRRKPSSLYPLASKKFQISSFRVFQPIVLSQSKVPTLQHSHSNVVKKEKSWPQLHTRGFG